MSNERYIIRANYFSYNDEWFYSDDYSEFGYGEVAEISHSLEEVMGKWKVLELRIRDLHCLNMPLDAMDGENIDRKRLESSALSFFGKSLDDIRLRTFRELSELIDTDRWLEFLQINGLCAYKLIQIEVSEKLYVALIPETGEYLFIPVIDPANNPESKPTLLFATSLERLLDIIANHSPTEWDLGQAAAEHDAKLGLLKAAARNSPNIQFNENNQILKWLNQDKDAFRMIYPLLPQPPFQIKEVELEQLFEIQNSLAAKQ